MPTNYGPGSPYPTTQMGQNMSAQGIPIYSGGIDPQVMQIGPDGRPIVAGGEPGMGVPQPPMQAGPSGYNQGPAPLGGPTGSGGIWNPAASAPPGWDVLNKGIAGLDPKQAADLRAQMQQMPQGTGERQSFVNKYLQNSNQGGGPMPPTPGQSGQYGGINPGGGPVDSMGNTPYGGPSIKVGGPYGMPGQTGGNSESLPGQMQPMPIQSMPIPGQSGQYGGINPGGMGPGGSGPIYAGPNPGQMKPTPVPGGMGGPGGSGPIWAGPNPGQAKPPVGKGQGGGPVMTEQPGRPAQPSQRQQLNRGGRTYLTPEQRQRQANRRSANLAVASFGGQANLDRMQALSQGRYGVPPATVRGGMGGIRPAGIRRRMGNS